MPNILKINSDDEVSKTNHYGLGDERLPLCIQDLMNHPTLTDPVFSIFKDFVKHN